MEPSRDNKLMQEQIDKLKVLLENMRESNKVISDITKKHKEDKK